VSVLSPLDKALTARLRGDATLVALVPGGIHSGSAPTTSAQPYLVFGNPVESEYNTLDAYGSDAEIELDTFSAPSVKSAQAVNAVLDRVEVLLRTPLVLEGHTTVRLRRAERRVFVDDDETRHGFARYRLFTFETA
jgi:hypothetical protein